MTPVEQFGRQLIQNGDLDPAYIVAFDAELKPDLLRKWVFLYSWFIHAGVTSHLAAQDHPYAAAMSELKILPRSPERRHFRAANAVRTLEYLKTKSPDAWLKYWFGQDTTYAPIEKRIREVPGFGAWTATKIIDMGEMLLGYSVDPPDPYTWELYKTPAEGAKMIASPGESQGDTLVRLASLLSDLTVPPLHIRHVDVREAETVLCRFKEFTTGTYQPGKEIRTTVNELLWRPNWIAKRMLERSSLWSFKSEGTTAQVSLRQFDASLTTTEYGMLSKPPTWSTA